MHVCACVYVYVCILQQLIFAKETEKKQRKEPKEKLQNEKNLQLLPLNRRRLSLLANHFRPKTGLEN